MKEHENEIEIIRVANGISGRIRVTGVVFVAIVAILSLATVAVVSISSANSSGTLQRPVINVHQQSTWGVSTDR